MSDVDAVTRIVGDRNRVAASVASGETVRAGTRETFTSVLGVAGDVHRRSSSAAWRAAPTSPAPTSTPSGGWRCWARPWPATLYGDRDPVGQQINIAGVRFRVVGVFAPLGQSLGVDRDNEVHIPLTTAHRVFATTRIDALAIRAPDRDSIDDLGQRIVAELSRRHPETEFSAVTQEQILGVLGDILGILTGVLAAIAGISLLVGGVGVSNIMLVSVRERTREIGLRKAVGARPRDIGTQFLLEAVLLTSLGGTIGMALGVGTVAAGGGAVAGPGGDHLVVAGAGVRGVGRGRHHLRRGAGPAGRAARPRGRPAHRVAPACTRIAESARSHIRPATVLVDPTSSVGDGNGYGGVMTAAPQGEAAHRRAAGRRPLPDGGRGRVAHAGVEDDGVPPGALEATSPPCGSAGRSGCPSTPSTPTCGARSAKPPDGVRRSTPVFRSRGRGATLEPANIPVVPGVRCRRLRAYALRGTIGWARSSRSAASVWPRRSTASCCARPASSVAVSASEAEPVSDGKPPAKRRAAPAKPERGERPDALPRRSATRRPPGARPAVVLVTGVGRYLGARVAARLAGRSRDRPGHRHRRGTAAGRTGRRSRRRRAARVAAAHR